MQDAKFDVTEEHDSCWEKAHELIAAGKEQEAVTICENEPCASKSVMCQKYLAWSFYKQDEFENASYWFSRILSSDDPEGRYGLACVQFARKEYAGAHAGYQLALELGYTRAYYWLGLLYEHGLGVGRDLKMAKEYYLRGASCGYLVAQRAVIQHVFRYGNLREKLVTLPRYVSLVLQGFLIAKKNPSDERLADIPRGTR